MIPLRALAKEAGQLADVVVRAKKLTRAEMDQIVVTLRECEKTLWEVHAAQRVDWMSRPEAAERAFK